MPYLHFSTIYAEGQTERGDHGFMKKVDTEKIPKNYADYFEAHRDEIINAAAGAIDPDVMGMTRDQALTLAGAMKACGFDREDFAAVMRKSSLDKGTFAKQWDRIKGSGKNGNCTEGTIFQYAKESGWKWPAPSDERLQHREKQNPKKNAPVLDLMAKYPDDFTLSCIFDSKEYKEKPTNVGEIRKRELSPTPAQVPITINDFAQYVISGRTFSPTVYNKQQTGTDENGKPKYDYATIMQQVFVVDIDNEEPALDENGKRINGQKKPIDNPLTIAEAMEICKKHGVLPFFVYETFSSKAHRDDPASPYCKFRLCFVVNKPITAQKYGEVGISKAINYFIAPFGKAADSSTTDSARLIFGTDEKDRAKLYANVIDHRKLMERVFASQDRGEETDAETDAEAGEDNTLPQIESLAAFSGNIPQPPEELIEGVLRVGHKMLIAGASKIGKSFLLMDLAICIAYGLKWLGFRCKKSRVLYLNLEIDHDSAVRRFAALHESMGYDNAELPENIDLWNLRGEAVPLDQLVEPILERSRGKQYAAIIIDPIYKVITGDENNATEMGRFCNQFDKICKGTGSAVIYCHHHSKGAQGHKSAIDRSSGSGVFARDPDAVLDICELELKSCDRSRDQNGKPFRLDCTLREFKKPPAVNFWFDHPKFSIDQTGNLAACSVAGGKQTSEEYSKQNEIMLREAFEELAAGSDEVKVKEVAETCNVTPKTIRNWNEKAGKPYKIVRGLMIVNDGFKRLPDTLDWEDSI